MLLPIRNKIRAWFGCAPRADMQAHDIIHLASLPDHAILLGREMDGVHRGRFRVLYANDMVAAEGFLRHGGVAALVLDAAYVEQAGAQMIADLRNRYVHVPVFVITDHVPDDVRADAVFESGVENIVMRGPVGAHTIAGVLGGV